MIKKLTVLAFILTLTGCAAMASVMSYLGDITNTYCLSSEAQREVYRAQFAIFTAPHVIHIKCEGDSLTKDQDERY